MRINGDRNVGTGAARNRRVVGDGFRLVAEGVQRGQRARALTRRGLLVGLDIPGNAGGDKNAGIFIGADFELTVRGRDIAPPLAALVTINIHR